MLLDTNVVSSFLRPGAEQERPKLFEFVSGVVATGSLTIATFTSSSFAAGSRS
ncbi:MAG TPA: hypothetical protein VI197_05075 [Polyangiaceae bacterium]